VELFSLFHVHRLFQRRISENPVFAAAANTGRKVRIIHQLAQPPDHPVNIYHPESEVFKRIGNSC